MSERDGPFNSFKAVEDDMLEHSRRAAATYAQDVAAATYAQNMRRGAWYGEEACGPSCLDIVSAYPSSAKMARSMSYLHLAMAYGKRAGDQPSWGLSGSLDRGYLRARTEPEAERLAARVVYQIPAGYSWQEEILLAATVDRRCELRRVFVRDPPCGVTLTRVSVGRGDGRVSNVAFGRQTAESGYELVGQRAVARGETVALTFHAYGGSLVTGEIDAWVLAVDVADDRHRREMNRFEVKVHADHPPPFTLSLGRRQGPHWEAWTRGLAALLEERNAREVPEPVTRADIAALEARVRGLGS